MSLRSALFAAGLAATLLAPVPALARDKSLSEAAEKLSDPRLQETIATAMASLSQALMGMKMAPFARAMETMGKSMGDATGEPADMPAIDPDATLGEMIGPDAERLPQELSARVPAMMGAMAGMAGAVEGMLPQLEAMGKQLKRSLPRN